ncbi:MAG TPA: hypothetical protein C5S37_03765, partial [Methanophagales archaeon]|nr:hypothetical protein [Methanophagales archaeon]
RSVSPLFRSESEVGEAAEEKGEGRREKGERWRVLYSYEEAWAMPVVVIDVERWKTRKTGYISLYTKLFKGGDV